MIPLFDMPLESIVNVLANTDCDDLKRFCKSKGKIFSNLEEYEEWNRSPLVVAEFYQDETIVQKIWLRYDKTYVVGRVKEQSQYCTRKQFRIHINSRGKIIIKNIHETSPASVDDKSLSYEDSVEKSDDVHLRFGKNCKIILRAQENNKYISFAIQDLNPKIFQSIESYTKDKKLLMRLGFEKYLTSTSFHPNVLIYEILKQGRLHEMVPHIESYRARDGIFEDANELHASDILHLKLQNNSIKFRNTFATVIIIDDDNVYYKIKSNETIAEPLPFVREEKIENFSIDLHHYDSIIDFRHNPPRFISNRLCSRQLMLLVAKEKSSKGIPFFKNVKVDMYGLSVKKQFVNACDASETFLHFIRELKKIEDHYSDPDYDYNLIDGVIYFAYMPDFDDSLVNIVFSKELLFYKPDFNLDNYTYIIDEKEYPLIPYEEVISEDTQVFELKLDNGKVDYRIFRGEQVPKMATIASIGEEFDIVDFSNDDWKKTVEYFKFPNDSKVFRNQIDIDLIKPIVYTQMHDITYMYKDGELNQTFFQHLEVPYWDEDVIVIPDSPDSDGFLRINITGESSRPPTPDMPMYVPGHGYMVL